MDTIIYVELVKAYDKNMFIQDNIKYFFPAFIGLLGVILGFILNRVNDSFVKGKIDLESFKKCLLLYSRGGCSYMDLYLLYSVLRKRSKKKIDIEKISVLSPDEKKQYCEQLIKSLKNEL